MVAKRAANRKAKQEEEEKPASEVDVSELVFDSEDGTDDGDDESEEYDSEVSAEEEEADTDNEIEHAVDDYVAGLRRMGPTSGCVWTGGLCVGVTGPERQQRGQGFAWYWNSVLNFNTKYGCLSWLSRTTLTCLPQVCCR